MAEGAPARLRRLEWIGSAKKDLEALPEEVVHVFGYALYLAQMGGRRVKELEDEQAQSH